MSDALRYAVLGLAAIAGKREQVQGNLAEIEAARAAKEQDFQQQVQLKTIESDLQLGRELTLKDRDFINEVRRGNVRNHLIGLPDGSVDVITTFGPRDDKTLFPEGSIQLGMALGTNAGTTGNPFLKANDYLPDVPEPLFTYNGVADTRAGHIARSGLGVEFNLGPSVGTRTRKNGNKFYSPDDRRSIFGSKFNRTFQVQSADGMVTTDNPARANQIRTETGNPIVVIDQEVDNNGAAIGEPKREVFKGQVALGERGVTNETYDLFLPTPKGVKVMPNLSEAEYLKALQDNNITDPNSVYTEVNSVKTDRYTGAFISKNQVRTIVPKDVEVSKTTYDILLPNGDEKTGTVNIFRFR